MHLLTDCRLATMAAPGYGLVEDGAVLVDGGLIAWAGPRGEVPDAAARAPVTALGGRLVTPALIDCHTHLVHGGDRSLEFEMRLEGASYEEVARAGGGIVSTMKATRAASVDELVQSARTRLDALIAEGVATVEIKSGYGLDIDSEIRMLRAARELARECPVTVVTSWLAAHALPPEYEGRKADYIDEVCIAGLARAQAQGLVDAVDAFCEGIAFSPGELRPLFKAARDLGLPVKLHAEQLSNLGGTVMACEFGAISADHLEYLDEGGVAAMARAGTVAVLLPGAFYTLRETQAPPVEALRAAGVPIAIATDANPGSSPLTSALLTMNMACTLFRLTPEEALAGFTVNAARALGLTDRGTIAPGQRADLAVWDVTHPRELAYRIGFNPLHARYTAGDLA